MPRLAAPGTLGIYCVVSFLYFGLPIARHPNSRTIGTGTDPYGFVWALEWWPHEILHGLNPFYSHAIWAPEGINLSWTTAIPALAILFAPLTLIAGPLVSYNVAAVLLPALAAWVTYLLCRRLTRSFWPSLAGGYLFGFSSYMLGHELGHLNLTPVFTIPLAALLVLRHLDGTTSRRRLAVELGILLAFIFGTSTEMLFTFTISLAVAIALGFVFFPVLRPALRSLLGPLSGAYALGLAIASPLAYYAISGFQSGTVNRTSLFPGDALNLVVPTDLIALGGTSAHGIARRFLGYDTENVLYLGLPILLIVIWYLVGERRRPASRFLAVALVAAFVASLGSSLYVAGRRLAPAPWRLVSHLPLFDNVITPRLGVYSALIASVIVALWGASPRAARPLRAVLLAVAVMSLIPRAFGKSPWEVTANVPPFFAATGSYKTCLHASDNLLVLPNVSDALLWQARDSFRFRLAVDDLQPLAPSGIQERAIVVDIQKNVVPRGGGAALLRFARANSVDEIAVVEADPGPWATTLAPVARPRAVQGILLYTVAQPRSAPACA